MNKNNPEKIENMKQLCNMIHPGDEVFMKFSDVMINDNPLVGYKDKYYTFIKRGPCEYENDEECQSKCSGYLFFEGLEGEGCHSWSNQIPTIKHIKHKNDLPDDLFEVDI